MSLVSLVSDWTDDVNRSYRTLGSSRSQSRFTWVLGLKDEFAGWAFIGDTEPDIRTSPSSVFLLSPAFFSLSV